MFPIKDNIPTDRLPLVTILLIAANVLVYFFLQGGGIAHGPREAQVVKYGAIPYEITHPGQQCGTTATVAGGARLQTGGQVVCPGETVTLSDGSTATVAATSGGGHVSAWLTLVTAMFLHGGILHLLGNMLFLWIFGANVEDAMSRLRYLAFYLLGGLTAVGLQVAMDPGSAVPTVGASGAIAAVLGGYILLYPRARVVALAFLILLFTLIELPAWVLLGLWFVEQAVLTVAQLTQPAGTGGGGGVAYAAHVGGFVFGLLAIRAFAQRRKSLPPPSAVPAWST
ncbi:MAG: rhomboid family intramembrane serine protease [Actinobacteria bacterium]|nr:rhomboid family intramembrane serine protease [Actinomycetota bacterium]